MSIRKKVVLSERAPGRAWSLRLWDCTLACGHKQRVKGKLNWAPKSANCEKCRAQPAERHQGELAGYVRASNLRNLRLAAHCASMEMTGVPRRDGDIPVYTRPAEQPAVVADQWPKLEKPALVGAGRFSAGLSARLVVEAAQRHYEFEVTPENEALRIATGENFLALLRQPVPAGFHLVPAAPTDDMIVAFAEAWYSKRQTIDDPDMLDAYRDMLAAAPSPDVQASRNSGEDKSCLK